MAAQPVGFLHLKLCEQSGLLYVCVFFSQNESKEGRISVFTKTLLYAYMESRKKFVYSLHLYRSCDHHPQNQGGGNPNLQLSPNPLLAQVTDTGLSYLKAERIVVRQDAGLEEYDGSPISEYIPEFEYKTERDDRFYLENAKLEMGNYCIIRELVKNFGPEGPGYPVAASLFPVGSLDDDGVAAGTTMANPYKWGDHNSHAVAEYRKVNDPTYMSHSVLITGLYKRSNDPSELDYSIEIKNSYGREWGDEGFAWITVDGIDLIKLMT